MRRRLAAARRSLDRCTARLFSRLVRPAAAWDPKSFQIWEDRGLHLTPVHFYFPIPDTRELAVSYPHRGECAGIDLRPELQLRLLAEVFPRCAAECAGWPKESTGGGFHLANDSFCWIDPFVYHGLIRHARPRTVIEVGAGYSTLVGVDAARRNGPTRYLCVDPFPRDFIARGVPGVELVRRPVQEMEISVFQSLAADDMLFVDSSHIVKTGGDVTFLVLEILPRLAPGVLVHFHDVFLPDEVPKDWVVDRHLFWTEQYLLQAYLADNPCVEVWFASHYISTRHPDAVRRAFPNALGPGGGSFWFRKLK
jgi:hypothetical protein